MLTKQNWPRYRKFCKSSSARPAPSLVAHSSLTATAFILSHSRQLLVIGWMDGQVSTWNVMDTLQGNLSMCACSNQGVHKKPLTVMMWNPSGTRLTTGDKARAKKYDPMQRHVTDEIQVALLIEGGGGQSMIMRENFGIVECSILGKVGFGREGKGRGGDGKIWRCLFSVPRRYRLN